MKRTLVILSAVLYSWAVSATVVTPDRARELASGFFGGATVEAVEGDGVATAEIPASSEVNPPFYVFNNPSGGWVIVSGEDCLNPVLAYSHSGSFCTGGLPDNLAWWLGAARSGVTHARKAGRKAGAGVREAWAANGRASAKSAGRSAYMETATWSQSSPYNFYCPDVTESTEGDPAGKIYKSITGCASLAMAIAMHCLKYPEHGTGTLESYSYTTDFKKQVEIQGFDISTHNYSYDSMPFTDSEVQSAGAAVQQQVARLIYDAGVAIKSEYNYSTGTSAYNDSVLPALTEHFGFDATVQYMNRANYALGEWIELLKTELDADRPILYGAMGNSMGHMFVLAGYDESDLFYINWGWAGINNGYFSIRDLYISEEYQFGEDHYAIMNLKPDEGGQREDVIELYGVGISVTSGAMEQGTDFKITAKSFNNETTHDYNGSVRAALVDRNDSLLCYAGSEYTISIPGIGSDHIIHSEKLSDYTCNVPQTMKFGDGLAFFYQTNLGGWKLVPYDRELLTLTRYGAYDACAIQIPETVKAGDVLAPSLMLGQTEVESVEWILDSSPIAGGQTAQLMAGVHVLKALITFADGSTETLVKEINVE